MQEDSPILWSGNRNTKTLSPNYSKNAMKTPTLMLSSTLIICLAVLFGWNKYSESQRYYIMNSGDGYAYRVDRRTGETWKLRGGTMSPVHEPEKEKSLEVVPTSIIAVLEGSAKYSTYVGAGGDFSVQLYNPSDWGIKEVTVAVYDKTEDDSSRWYREFKEDVDLESKGTAFFSIETAGGESAGANKWTVISARGLRP